MSTPLVILASILAVFALVLVPLMMFKSGQPRNHGRKKPQKKKKKR